MIQLQKDDMEVETQKEVKVFYNGKEVGLHQLDLIVEKIIIVEVKAIKTFDETHIAQLLSYLKATGLKMGLLLNFAKSTLTVKRVVR